MESQKKVAPKKAAPRKQSIIRYAEKQLVPKEKKVSHPLRVNDFDKTIILPGAIKDISTGLEVAIPPECIAITNMSINGILFLRQSYYGYQKDLTLQVMNVSQQMIELEPFEEIGHMWLTEVKNW